MLLDLAQLGEQAAFHRADRFVVGLRRGGQAFADSLEVAEELEKRACRVPAASAISAASATIRSWRQPSSIVRSRPISEVGLTSRTLRSSA